MKKTNTNIINDSFQAWKFGTYNAKNPRTRKRYDDTMEYCRLVAGADYAESVKFAKNFFAERMYILKK